MRESLITTQKIDFQKWASFNNRASKWIVLIGAGLSLVVGIAAIILTLALGSVVPMTILSLLAKVVAVFGSPATITTFAVPSVGSAILFGVLSTTIGLGVTLVSSLVTGVISALGFLAKFALSLLKSTLSEFKKSNDLEKDEKKDESTVTGNKKTNNYIGMWMFSMKNGNIFIEKYVQVDGEDSKVLIDDKVGDEEYRNKRKYISKCEKIDFFSELKNFFKTEEGKTCLVSNENGEVVIGFTPDEDGKNIWRYYDQNRDVWSSYDISKISDLQYYLVPRLESGKDESSVLEQSENVSTEETFIASWKLLNGGLKRDIAVLGSDIFLLDSLSDSQENRLQTLEKSKVFKELNEIVAKAGQGVVVDLFFRSASGWECLVRNENVGESIFKFSDESSEPSKKLSESNELALEDLKNKIQELKTDSEEDKSKKGAGKQQQKYQPQRDLFPGNGFFAQKQQVQKQQEYQPQRDLFPSSGT